MFYFVIFENPCHLKFRCTQAWFSSRLLAADKLVEGKSQEKHLQPEALLSAWGCPWTWVQTEGTSSTPTCSQLDFLRHLIQSEAVSFSSILQPINHAGNKIPDSMPSYQLLKSLWPGKSANWKNIYGRGHSQPSINKLSLFLHLMGGDLNLARPHWHRSHSCFHLKPPFHSAGPRPPFHSAGIYRDHSNESQHDIPW